MAVLDENGKIDREVRVENANLDKVAQEYAGSEAAIEATSNYYAIHDTLSEYLDVTVASPGKLKLIANSDKIESTVNDSVSSFWSCIDTNSRNCSLLN